MALLIFLLDVHFTERIVETGEEEKKKKLVCRVSLPAARRRRRERRERREREEREKRDGNDVCSS